MKKLAVSLIAVSVLALAGCRPCGCSDADLTAATIAWINQVPGLGATVNGANFHFDSPLIGDDRFTLTLSSTDAAGPHSDSYTGTYDKSGDTITFKFDPKGGRSQGLIQGGTKYTLTCGKDEQGHKLLKLRGPGMTGDLVFTCRS